MGKFNTYTRISVHNLVKSKQHGKGITVYNINIFCNLKYFFFEEKLSESRKKREQANPTQPSGGGWPTWLNNDGREQHAKESKVLT